MDKNYIENTQQENEKEISNEQKKCAFCNCLKKITKFDLIVIISVIIIALFACFAKFHTHKIGTNPVQKEQKVAIQVFFKNLIISDNNIPFKISEKAFITIRNVPYTSLNILDVNYDEKKAIIATPRSKQGYMVVPDVTLPLQFDFLVTLEDTVKVSQDGEYVVGGNKLKIGLPIVLEGKDYRFNGVISSIKEINDNSNKSETVEE